MLEVNTDEKSQPKQISSKIYELNCQLCQKYITNLF